MQDHNWGRHHQVCQIYCANFVYHGMPVELVTQLAKFATKNPIAVIFTLWLSACCSLQRLNDSRPCLSKIHISKREPWHSARCLLKPGNTMMEYDVFPFIVHDGCAMCLLSFQCMHFDSVMTLRAKSMTFWLLSYLLYPGARWDHQPNWKSPVAACQPGSHWHLDSSRHAEMSTNAI